MDLQSKFITAIYVRDLRRQGNFSLVSYIKKNKDFLYENMLKVIPKFSTYSLTQPIEIFMNGISSEPDPRNISIVFAVQKYILQTK